MTDRQRAERAYQRIIAHLFDGDDNPTYTMCGASLANLTSKGEVFLMEEYKLIKYIGDGWNKMPQYQVRF